jgi:hypothetical protein
MAHEGRPASLTVNAPRLALAGVVMPFWVLGFSTILALTRTGYDLVWDPISKLGAEGARDPLIWQLGGFFVGGVLELAYAGALWATLGRSLAAVLTGVSGAMLVLSAFAPLGSSLTNIHQLAGIVLFVCLALTPLAAWLQLRGRPEWTGVALPSLIVSGLLILWLVLLPNFASYQLGFWQRTLLLVALGWQVVFALRVRRMAVRRA